MYQLGQAFGQPQRLMGPSVNPNPVKPGGFGSPGIGSSNYQPLPGHTGYAEFPDNSKGGPPPVFSGVQHPAFVGMGGGPKTANTQPAYDPRMAYGAQLPPSGGPRPTGGIKAPMPTMATPMMTGGVQMPPRMGAMGAPNFMANPRMQQIMASPYGQMFMQRLLGRQF